MSIYATGFRIGIEDEMTGDPFETAYWEVWFQHVPNHINEQNGYGGPGWDEWLPAFEHEPGCEMHESTIGTLRGDRDLVFLAGSSAIAGFYTAAWLFARSR